MGNSVVTAVPLPRRRRTRRRLSPLTLRVLAVNVLPLAVLVVGLLYLGRYSERLVQAELHSLRVEARIYAGAIAEAAVRIGDEEAVVLEPELARPMVRRLVETTETRTRLFDATGQVVADSRVLTGSGGIVQIEELPPPPPDNPLIRLAFAVYDGVMELLPQHRALPRHDDSVETLHLSDEVLRALSGDNASQVWQTQDGSLLLTVASPVQRYKQVLGAVQLSRAGTHIDTAVRSVRFDILRMFGIALLVTVLLSLYMASTIARPIRRLARAADRVRYGHGRSPNIPDLSGRGDEIGDLSAALRAMTHALWARLDAIERFAADVAHEIKNPLTSLRSAVETVRRVNDPERRNRLLQIIEDDVQRLNRLITDISEASRLDAELSRAEARMVDLGRMLTMLASLHDPGDDAASPALPGERPRVRVVEGGETGILLVPGLEERLVQVFRNLILNALSFSPPGGTVRLSAVPSVDGNWAEIRVEDDGPGIPDGKCEAIFERFYSERPQSEQFGLHSGLGLSISRQIIDAHHGQIRAENRRDSDGKVLGAVFTVCLPRDVPAHGHRQRNR